MLTNDQVARTQPRARAPGFAGRLTARYYIGRAQQQQARGNFGLAAKLYKRAVDLGAGRENVLKQYANMLKDSGEYAAAELVYEQCLQQAPLNPDTSLQLGHLFKLAGDKDKALSYYRTALQLSPEFLPARLEVVALLKERGNFHKDQGVFEHALPAYEEALQLLPDDADTYLQMARLFQRNANFAKAFAHLTKAVQLDPSLAHHLDELAPSALGFEIQAREAPGDTSADRASVSPSLASAFSKVIPEEVRIDYPLTESFFRGLRWHQQDRPAVSLVILSYQRPDLVENLIKSIWLFTEGYPYEIIVVDNGSPPGTHVLKPQIRNRIRRITLTRNQYLGDAYNIGAESARGRYLVMFNNDIIVTPNWLQPLIKELETNSAAGIVGPKFLYPNGVLQEAGGLIDSAANVIQRGKRGKAEAPEFNIKEDVDYVTGATMAVPRDLYLDVLGYDWRWAPGYFEDPDFCFKVAARGYKTVYNPASEVFHIEGATMSSMPVSSNIQMAIQINREAFATKWGSAIDNRDLSSVHLAPAGAALRALEQVIKEDTPGRKLGIYFPYEFIPGGGEQHCLNVAYALRDEYTPYFIFESRESLLRIISVTNDLGHSDLDFRVITWDRAKELEFDVFILLGNCLFPERAGIGRSNFYICQFPFPVGHDYLSRLDNLKTPESYDAVWVYSDYVRDRVRERYDAWGRESKDIETIYPAIPSIGLAQNEPGNNIVGVGRFFIGGHNKRHDRMIEAFGRIVKSSPETDAVLHLAGAVHNAPEHRNHLVNLRTMARDLPVEFHLNMDRPALNRLYQSGKVYWHAAGWGVDTNTHPEAVEHFGISVVEAMSAGCIPVVYAVGGPLEIVRHGVNGFTAVSIEEMADWTGRLLQEWDTPRVRQMRQAAIETARGFNLSVFSDRIMDSLHKHAHVEEISPIPAFSARR
jgi:GT2 family glycosyltransferase/glycosyltransferase involved in cell wall biosynthesis/Tfp pilus assembly protein PilF